MTIPYRVHDSEYTYLEELSIYLYNQRPLYYKYIAEFLSIFSYITIILRYFPIYFGQF